MNATKPLPWVAPNPEPLIVTTSPALAVVGLIALITVPLIAVVDVPIAKTCNCPRVAREGKVTLASVLPGSTGMDVEKMSVSTLSCPPVQLAQLRYVVFAATRLPNDGCALPPFNVQSERPSQ